MNKTGFYAAAAFGFLGLIATIGIPVYIIFNVVDLDSDEFKEELEARLEAMEPPVAVNVEDPGIVDSEVESTSFDTDFCSQEPEGTDIGRMVYPIAPEYKQLPFLGQIFTAASCDAELMKLIDGVVDDLYTMGVYLWLDEQPSQSLQAILEEIGLECNEESDACTEWSTSENILIEDILKLQPFASEIKQDDCRNCG